MEIKSYYFPALGDFVKIPDSILGKQFGIGVVVAVWNDTIQVNFSGAIGQYTASKHTIYKVNEEENGRKDTN